MTKANRFDLPLKIALLIAVGVGGYLARGWVDDKPSLSINTETKVISSEQESISSEISNTDKKSLQESLAEFSDSNSELMTPDNGYQDFSYVRDLTYQDNLIATKSESLSSQAGDCLGLSASIKEQLGDLMSDKLKRDKDLVNLMTSIVVSASSSNEELSPAEEEIRSQEIDDRIKSEIGDSWEESRKQYDDAVSKLLPAEKLNEYREFELRKLKEEQVSSIDIVVSSVIEKLDDLQPYQTKQIQLLGEEYKTRELPYAGLGTSIALDEGESLFAHPEKLVLYSEFQQSVLDQLTSDQQQRFIAQIMQQFSNDSSAL